MELRLIFYILFSYAVNHHVEGVKTGLAPFIKQFGWSYESLKTLGYDSIFHNR